MDLAKKWDDIDDILYDGTRDEISKVKCPNCGNKIYYSYSPESGSMEIGCRCCGYLSRAYRGPKPNCALIYGDSYDWENRV